MRFNTGAVRCANPPTTAEQHPMLLAGKDANLKFTVGDDIPEGSWILEDVDQVEEEFGATEPEDDRLIAEIETILDRAAAGKLSYSSNPRDKRSSCAKRSH